MSDAVSAKSAGLMDDVVAEHVNRQSGDAMRQLYSLLQKQHTTGVQQAATSGGSRVGGVAGALAGGVALPTLLSLASKKLLGNNALKNKIMRVAPSMAEQAGKFLSGGKPRMYGAAGSALIGAAGGGTIGSSLGGALGSTARTGEQKFDQKGLPAFITNLLNGVNPDVSAVKKQPTSHMPTVGKIKTSSLAMDRLIKLASFEKLSQADCVRGQYSELVKIAALDANQHNRRQLAVKLAKACQAIRKGSAPASAFKQAGFGVKQAAVASRLFARRLHKFHKLASQIVKAANFNPHAGIDGDPFAGGGGGGGLMGLLKDPRVLALLAAGGGGALLGANSRPSRPVRGAVSGAAGGMGGLAGLGLGAGLGGLAGGAIGNAFGRGTTGNGALLGTLAGAGLGAYGGYQLGHAAGGGANALTGDDQRDLMYDGLAK